MYLMYFHACMYSCVRAASAEALRECEYVQLSSTFGKTQWIQTKWTVGNDGDCSHTWQWQGLFKVIRKIRFCSLDHWSLYFFFVVLLYLTKNERIERDEVKENTRKLHPFVVLWREKCNKMIYIYWFGSPNRPTVIWTTK